MKKGITVFTPIYNRAYCIKTLYESLKKQTYKNFEWIVVDDGSTDDIAQLFDKWVRVEEEFDIIYVKVSNKGKMPALNKGVQLSNAPFFFIVDSDDCLTSDALEYVVMWSKEVQNDDSFVGVSGLRKIKTVEAEYDFDYIDATNLERRKYNLTMDMAECYKTDILKKYPSPEIEGENYLSPSIVWNKIAKDGYKVRWHNRVIYIAEYRPDGLTMTGPDKFKKNPIGWGQLIQLNIECKNDIEYAEFQSYLYYKELKDKLSIEQLSENLGISRDKLENIISQKPTVIKKMNEYFRDNGLREVALYGLGQEAKRFMLILEDLDIRISYGIDRVPNSLLKICYKPTDELPKVDAVLITNLRKSDEIKRDLKKYVNINCISLQEDILRKGFRYYFSDI